MTKPYGLPKSKVHEPWNDHCPFSKKAERDKYRFRKKTARQGAKKEIRQTPPESVVHPDEIHVCQYCGDSYCEVEYSKWKKGVDAFPGLAGNALKVPVFRFLEIPLEDLEDLEDTINHIGKTGSLEIRRRASLVKHAQKLIARMRGKNGKKDTKRNSRHAKRVS